MTRSRTKLALAPSLATARLNVVFGYGSGSNSGSDPVVGAFIGAAVAEWLTRRIEPIIPDENLRLSPLPRHNNH